MFSFTTELIYNLTQKEEILTTPPNFACVQYEVLGVASSIFHVEAIMFRVHIKKVTVTSKYEGVHYFSVGLQTRLVDQILLEMSQFWPAGCMLLITSLQRSSRDS